MISDRLEWCPYCQKNTVQMASKPKEIVYWNCLECRKLIETQNPMKTRHRELKINFRRIGIP